MKKRSSKKEILKRDLDAKNDATIENKKKKPAQLTLILICWCTPDDSAVIRVSKQDRESYKVVPRKGLNSILKSLNLLIQGGNKRAFQVEFECMIDDMEYMVPKGIQIVENTGIYKNILVLTKVQVDLSSGQLVPWQKSNILLKLESGIQIPCTNVNLNVTNVERNKFLKNVLNMYGKQGFLIMVMLLAHITSILFSGVRNHDLAGLLLVGVSQSFKSHLLKLVARAVGYEKNVVSESHTPSSVHNVVLGLVSVFDDIGKSGSSAKFKLGDMNALFRSIFNAGSIGSRSKVYQATSALFACLNFDNFEKFRALDDAESTLFSRLVRIFVFESSILDESIVINLSMLEQEAIVQSLASLQYDIVKKNIMQEKISNISGNRAKRSLAIDLCYGYQICESFITSHPECDMKMRDLDAFVEKNMNKSLTFTGELVEAPQVKIVNDLYIETLHLIKLQFFEENGELQAYLNRIDKKKELVIQKSFIVSNAYDVHPRRLFDVLSVRTDLSKRWKKEIVSKKVLEELLQLGATKAVKIEDPKGVRNSLVAKMAQLLIKLEL
jgi:hypothetical protein